MGNVPVLKPAEVVAILRKLGFAEVRQRGSHKQFREARGGNLLRCNPKLTGLASSRVDAVANPEHPEMAVKHIVRGIVRRGLQPLPAKASISLRVDQDVLEWFKAQGAGYQTRINTVLRAFRDASV